MNARELYIVRLTLSTVFGAALMFHGLVHATVGMSWPLIAFVVALDFVTLGFWWAEQRQRRREQLAGSAQ
jgi:hypothetical protein